MPTAQDIRGTVFKNGTAVLMARVIGPDATAIMQADLDTIYYSILEIDPCRPDTLTPVTGHDNVELTVSDIVYDTLQTGGLWTVDATGYNFRHDLDVSSNEAFPYAHVDYQARYELTPVVGQKVVVRFLLHAV